MFRIFADQRMEVYDHILKTYDIKITIPPIYELDESLRAERARLKLDV
jgi:hypothetical protein